MDSLKTYLSHIQLESLRGSHDCAMEILKQHVQSNSKVLDLGADNMQVLEELRRSFLIPDNNLFGIDYNSISIAEARTRGFQAFRIDLSHEPLPPDIHNIDIALCLQTIEHLLNPHYFLRNVFAALSPGGRFICTTPNQAAWFNIFHLVLGLPPSSGPHMDSEIVRRKLAIFIRVWNDHQDVAVEENRFRHLHVHTVRGLRALLEHVGFEVVEQRCFGYHPFPFVLSKLLCKLDPWHSHHMLFHCKKP